MNGRNYKASANPHWLGKQAGYASKHQFLKRNFGIQWNCELCGVLGGGEKDGRWSIQWAKKQGSEYTHERNDYLALCRSCHRKYDMTDKEKVRLKELSNNQTPAQLSKLSVKRKAISKLAHREKGRFASSTGK